MEQEVISEEVIPKEIMDFTVFKIRRSTDKKYLRKGGTIWGPESLAKIYPDISSVTSILLLPQINGTNLEDIEVIQFYCDPVRCRPAGEWVDIEGMKHKINVKKANNFYRFVVAIILQGHFIDNENISHPICSDENGWVSIDEIVKVIGGITADKFVKTLCSINRITRDHKLVINQESDAIKVIKREPKTNTPQIGNNDEAESQN